MKMTNALKLQNILRACRFQTPDFIPMTFWVCPACWHHYDQNALADLIESHPLLFPDFVRPELPYTPVYDPVARKDQPLTDSFGCVWHTSDDGITGTVLEHPLADWDAFAAWQPPDPDTCNGLVKVDWQAALEGMKAAKKQDGVLMAGLRHGHTFLQLCDIRGYENLLFDMMDEEPKLDDLIQILVEFNLNLVKKFLSAGADVVCYPEDLGMQRGPMLSPENFRRYIKPAYRKIIAPAREAGAMIHMHSDGDLHVLADDLIDGGVDSLNLQDLVNGVDWIADRFRGKTCIDLDIDRQSVTPFAPPEEIHRFIREEVEKISTPQGGLTMTYGLYPGLPLQNVKAVMDAMEACMFFYS